MRAAERLAAVQPRQHQRRPPSSTDTAGRQELALKAQGAPYRGMCCRSQCYEGGSVRHPTFGCLDLRVVAMLAEILMVRLEAAVRPVQEKLPSSVSPFVPFSPSAQLTFKRNEDGAPEGAREKRSS